MKESRRAKMLRGIELSADGVQKTRRAPNVHRGSYDGADGSATQDIAGVLAPIGGARWNCHERECTYFISTRLQSEPGPDTRVANMHVTVGSREYAWFSQVPFRSAGLRLAASLGRGDHSVQ